MNNTAEHTTKNIISTQMAIKSIFLDILQNVVFVQSLSLYIKVAIVNGKAQGNLL